MKKWIAAAGVLLLATQATAETECPKFAPGQAYPWQTKEIMPGDQWAELHIDLDVNGRPKNCRIGKNNLKPEMGFFMCRAVTAQSFQPVQKDGVAVEGTVIRNVSLPGRAHLRADEEARKKFFKDNPTERSSCYPY